MAKKSNLKKLAVLGLLGFAAYKLLGKKDAPNTGGNGGAIETVDQKIARLKQWEIDNKTSSTELADLLKEIENIRVNNLTQAEWEAENKVSWVGQWFGKPPKPKGYEMEQVGAAIGGWKRKR